LRPKFGGSASPGPPSEVPVTLRDRHACSEGPRWPDLALGWHNRPARLVSGVGEVERANLLCCIAVLVSFRPNTRMEFASGRFLGASERAPWEPSFLRRV